jgi:hypothetical protein
MKKKQIYNFLISGFGVPLGLRIPNYKPSIAERIMFRLINGRELKDSDYRIGAIDDLRNQELSNKDLESMPIYQIK